ncbi:MAG: SpoIIE family protein phosphatase [Oscillospiraceae bacterium]|nr:SpoIIE family protein phosphatase [Oscillospiraceae bacterium]
MKNALPSISTVLRRWLLLGTLGVFVIVSSAMVFLQFRLALRDIRNLLQITVRDVSQDIQEASDEDALVTARQLASAYLSGDYTDLKQLKRLYDLSEINVIDSSGIIVESTEPRLLGYDMASGRQSAEFLVLLGDKDSYVQPLQPINIDETILRKYAGVKLSDDSFILAGFSAEQCQNSLADNLQEITRSRHVMENGKVFVLDAELNLVSGRDDLSGERLKRIFSEGDKLGEPNEMVLINDAGLREYWLYDILKGYRIVAVLSQNEALASVRGSAISRTVTGVVLMIIINLGIAHVVKAEVQRPVDAVAEALSSITGGNLDRRLDIRSSREFARISDEINETVDALKGYIDREAARIDEELAYARRIQVSALPVLTGTYTDDPAFRLYTSMDTAREVGGDFYDFYKTEKGTLAFLIADVSDKGIPAAMFMMTGKTVLRDSVERMDGIGSAMAYANRHLCEGNEAGMFITAWVGLLNLESGVVHFANAGHNPPVLIRDGQARMLEMDSDLILAVMDDTEYKTQMLKLEPHDLLFLYTDGVTEACNGAKELYGEKRLLEALRGVVPMEDNICELVCRRVKTSVDAFAAGAPQTDDITMLCLYYCGQNT